MFPASLCRRKRFCALKVVLAFARSDQNENMYLPMNCCQERGQPCARKPLLWNSQAKLSAVQSPSPSWSRCVTPKLCKPLKLLAGLNRWLIRGLLLTYLLCAGSAHGAKHPFSTVGIYIGPPKTNDTVTYPFLKACGYNYLEFCDTGFAKRPDQLPAYYAEMNAAIERAQREGFKVWILLLACMRQWNGPATNGSAGTFSALNQEVLRERLRFIEQAVKGLPAADGFEFFAGDPGGDPEGRSTVQDCMAFARSVRAIAQRTAPRAGFAVNLWAVAEWAGFPSPFTLEFWRKQVQLSRAVAEDEAMLGRDCGVVFSMDNYYRSLALACYADAAATLELFPSAAAVAALRRKSVTHVLGWPYFLVDEVDDGYIKPNNVASRGQAQAETRYIRALIDKSRDIGLDGLVANSAYTTSEALNIYAFGRMCRAPKLKPEAALDEWAGIIADDSTKAELGCVLRFIENHSNWENSLPPAYRLPALPCQPIASATNAIERLGYVVPRIKPPIPLLEPPASYMGRLRRRLDMIAAGNIGGVNPIVRSSR